MQSSVTKLLKFIKLEIDRGYDNRAVMGGFSKILPAWQAEARADRIEETLIIAVAEGLDAYASADAEERAAILQTLQSQLSQADEGEPAIMPAESPLPPAAQADPSPSRDVPATPQDDEAAGLNAPVRVMQGIGKSNDLLLASVGIETIEDLLYYFPRRYDDYSLMKSIKNLTVGDTTTVLGTVKSFFQRPIKGGKMHLTEMVVSDGTGAVRVTWFNRPWMGGKFPTGTQVILAGKIEQYLGRPTMSNPEIETIEQEHLSANRIVPIYPLTERLTQKMLRKWIWQTVNYWGARLPDFLPEAVRQAVKLIPLGQALQNVHFPESQDMLDVSRWRLAFDEIFLLQLGVQRMRRTWQMNVAQTFDTPAEWLAQQINRLPYALTGAQQRVLGEALRDLASGHPMERLVQGDVGSGKTVVAALIAAAVARHGAQSALMAPTSILAEQHYRSLSALLTQGENAPLAPEALRLLTGDTSAAEREAIHQGLADGSVQLLIGTHALIEGPVVFQRLQLAIIDEQHRFGVAQRAQLRAKGENLHLLVMTATPIPRSLALTIYGDLDVSVIDELPAGRQPIETHVLRPNERERAYSLIESQLAQGRQVFVIYPLIEASETGDVPAAVEQSQFLQSKVFPKYKVGLLHGRMKPEEKDEVMRRFRDREYHVLVSTTVVEVGVDVPNASVMLIEGADRFGLAQLHQLRGRVGRGSDQSYCLLIPVSEDAIENERLEVMAETNDGFVLAERDLQQRGPGDFLGTRQAGTVELRMASLTDIRLIEKAREQAQIMFRQDPELSAPQHRMLAEKLERFWVNGRGDIS